MNAGSRCWASLPSDALAYIINECSLAQSDVAAIRLVCVHWRSTTNSHLKSLAPACTSLEQVAGIALRFPYLTNCDLTRCDTRLVGHASLCRDASARLSTLLAALARMPSLTSLHISDTFSERMGQKHWASLVCAQALVDVAQPQPQPPVAPVAVAAPPLAQPPASSARVAVPAHPAAAASTSVDPDTATAEGASGTDHPPGGAAVGAENGGAPPGCSRAASTGRGEEAPATAAQPPVGAVTARPAASTPTSFELEPPPETAGAAPTRPATEAEPGQGGEEGPDDGGASAAVSTCSAADGALQAAVVGPEAEVRADEAAVSTPPRPDCGGASRSRSDLGLGGRDVEAVEEVEVQGRLVPASGSAEAVEAEGGVHAAEGCPSSADLEVGPSPADPPLASESPAADSPSGSEAAGASLSFVQANAAAAAAGHVEAAAAPPPPPPPPLVLSAAELADPGIKSFARAISRPGATHQHAFWLPDWCGRLAGLQELHVRGRQRPSAGLPPCLLWLHAGRTAAQLTSLSLVRLSLATLPEQLQHLTGLTRLVAQDCSLSLMPRGLASGLSRLEYMDLSLNGLTSLPSDFTQLTSLKHLDLQRNKLAALPLDIGRLSGVTSLLLNNNQLRQLPPSLASMRCVEVLSCSYNWLGGMGPSLPLLCSLPKLRRLELACVSDVRCRLVPPQELRMLAANLTHLDLAANNLVPADVLGSLTSLRSLVLSDCGLLAVPPWVRRLAPCLQHLDLSNNSLSELPSWLSACTRLRYLSIAHNRLSIRVPPSVLEQMPQLEVVESE